MTSREPRTRQAADGNAHPLVARRQTFSLLPLMIGGVLAGGLALFLALDAQRRSINAPASPVGPQAVRSLGAATSLPPLQIPEQPLSIPPPPPRPDEAQVVAPLTPSGPAPVRPPVSAPPAPGVYVPRPPQPPPMPQPAYAPPPAHQVTPLPITASPSAVVIDAGRVRSSTPIPSQSATAGSEAMPVLATRIGRRNATVPQGALIPAVLETAIDSTRPGPVRAVVSRDILSFGGGSVLVPRGTRLFGEYQSDLGPGQSRAYVTWVRLVRPDGVTVALASPAADNQGRTGIEGRVDNHFLERFTSALLQTTVNLGASLAGRSLGDGAVVVALPGGGPANVSQTDREIRPTLHVAAGQRVSAVVARDLELPPVARSR